MARTQKKINGTALTTQVVVKLEIANSPRNRSFPARPTTYSIEEEIGMKTTLIMDVISIKWL